MENLRFKALAITLTREKKNIDYPPGKVSEFFGENTFNRKAMREFLTVEAFTRLINAIEKSEKIERRMADQIAAGIKAWALSKGATHYTHWFHPLTGTSAEKHDF